MNMKKKIVLTAIAFNIGFFSLPLGKGWGWAVFSQNEVDALRYSQTNFLGTARSSAMAGAFGALGGDFSTLSTNPAGIGIYRRSELSFTPSFFTQSTNAEMHGASLYDSKSNFNFGNAGLVLSYSEENSHSKWKGVMIGFGYNRISNFNNRISMSGVNKNGSLLDVYVADANATGDKNNLDQFGTNLAYQTYLINFDSTSNSFWHVIPNHGETQTKYVETSGAMGETVFTVGGNYDDKLFLGGTIGIPHIRYTETSTYTESLAKDTIYGFKEFKLNQNLNTTGAGVNFKFGMIYKPTDWMRIGGAFHSPSYFNMHDDWSSDMSSTFTGNNAQYSSSYQSPQGTFDYSLTTPARAIGSIGFIIKKIGVIAADYEYVDYSSARLHSATYSFINENKNISQKYTAAGNVRLGAEVRLQPMTIRGGFAYYGSPYKQGVGNDGSRMSYTAGIGFREQSFFIDFAFVLTVMKENYYFYNPDVNSGGAYVDPSINTSKASSVMMTVGFKF